MTLVYELLCYAVLGSGLCSDWLFAELVCEAGCESGGICAMVSWAEADGLCDDCAETVVYCCVCCG